MCTPALLIGPYFAPHILQKSQAAERGVFRMRPTQKAGGSYLGMTLHRLC